MSVTALPRWQPRAAMVAALVALAAAFGLGSFGSHSNVLVVTGTLTAAIPGTTKCYDVRNTGAFGFHTDAYGGSTSVEVGVPWRKSRGSFDLGPPQSYFYRDNATWAVTSGTFHIDQFDGTTAAGRLDAHFLLLPPGSMKTIHVLSAWSCKVMPFVVN